MAHPEAHYVITSRPLISPPRWSNRGRANSPPLRRTRQARLSKVGVEGWPGDPRLIDIGRLDSWRWDHSVVLGEGSTLPAAPGTEARLVKCELKSGGALHVVYERRVSGNVAQ